jgi:hypothetical protein
MSEFRRAEAEIFNMKRLIDYSDSIGHFKRREQKKAFDKMLKNEGYPGLKEFRDMNINE